RRSSRACWRHTLLNRSNRWSRSVASMRPRATPPKRRWCEYAREGPMIARRRAETKQVAIEEAAHIAARWEAHGEAPADACGAFGVIEADHIRALRAARDGKGRLVVAVLADRDAAGLGSGRPVLAAADRATLVAALRIVDLVFVASSPAGSDLARVAAA